MSKKADDYYDKKIDNGLYENSSETYDFKGDGCFKLKPSKYGGWEMYHIDLQGLTIA